MSGFGDVAMPPPEVRVYRALWKNRYDENVGLTPLAFRRDVIDLLRDGKNDEELRAYLDSRNIDPKTREPKKFQVNHMVAYEAHHAFHKTSAHPSWDEVPIPNRLSWRDRIHRVLWGQRSRP